MKSQPLVSGPFAHAGNATARTMGWVMVALLPATLYGLYQFGWPAIFLFLLTLISALLAEALSLRLAGKPVRRYLFDGSALLSGWLLAMTLPPWAPWWIGVVGALLMIIVGKQVFGGIGQNLFNPAMVARVGLLIAFPLQMTTFLPPQPLGSAAAPGIVDALQITLGDATHLDTLSGATLLGHVKTELGQTHGLESALSGIYDPLTAATGAVAGSLGETSALLLLLGGLLLLGLGIIRWTIPVSMLVTITLLSTLFHWIDPNHYPNALYHLLAGATLLGAFFIATDLVTSPVTTRGQLLFGAGCGLLIYVIRSWGGYPEGVAFAVLLMNGATPLIDHYLRPRIYGRKRSGAPLTYPSRSKADSSNGGAA